MTPPEKNSASALPTRSRTLDGGLPPEADKVEHAVHPEGAPPTRGESPDEPKPQRHRRRKSRAPKEPLAVFSDSPSPSAEVPPSRGILLLAIGAAVFLSSMFFVARFFYDSGVDAGMRRALAPEESAGPVDAGAVPQAAIFNAILNLRSSQLDRPTVDVLTPLVLAALQSTPDESLPGHLQPGHTTVEDFAAVHVAMRLGDFGKAAAILRDVDKKLPPDQFSYLMNDPALREFAREPRVMGFY